MWRCAVLMTEEQLLAEARAAIERLDDGTFGKCERCGRTIAKLRLNAIPYARDCIICPVREFPTGRIPNTPHRKVDPCGIAKIPNRLSWT